MRNKLQKKMLTKKRKISRVEVKKKSHIELTNMALKTMQDWWKQVCTLEIGEGQRVLAMKDREQF